jgi:16S rRNA (cytosine967-C5)-methyltransferase
MPEQGRSRGTNDQRPMGSSSRPPRDDRGGPGNSSGDGRGDSRGGERNTFGNDRDGRPRQFDARDSGGRDSGGRDSGRRDSGGRGDDRNGNQSETRGYQNDDRSRRGRPITSREIAMRALAEVDNGAFANLVLPEIFRGLERFAPIDDRDKAFATELVYGTVRMRRACDYLIQRLIEREPDEETLRALHLGAYQLVFLGVPPHAAVAETVELAPEWSRGFTNAILRRLAGEITPVWPNLATELSYPDWIVDTLINELGIERARRVLAAMNEPADVYSREDGYVQDPASQVVAESVGACAGERILDVCAAPGGKTTLMAASGASVTALDVHMHRARLVRRNAVELGCIERVGVAVADSTHLPVPDEFFDRVLIDAPCSGLGSLRRRPDARWRMSPDDVKDLVKLQKALLRSAAAAVKPGGVLVYSVCTLTAEETIGIDKFMEAGFPDFEVLPPIDAPGWEPIGRGARILPGITDGMAAFHYRKRT